MPIDLNEHSLSARFSFTTFQFAVRTTSVVPNDVLIVVSNVPRVPQMRERDPLTKPANEVRALHLNLDVSPGRPRAATGAHCDAENKHDCKRLQDVVAPILRKQWSNIRKFLLQIRLNYI